MTAGRTSRDLLLVLLLAATTACGNDNPKAPALRLEGPPVHEATRVALPGNARGVIVRARSPCRLTLSIEGLDGGPKAFPPRDLAAGEDVRVWWEAQLETVGLPMNDPSEADRALGRTKAVGPQLTFAFDDRAILSAGTSFYVRPDAPQLVVRDYLPPVRPEPLAFGATTELVTLVVADVGEATVRVRPAEGRNRVVPPPADLESPDQVRVLRLYLRVDPVD